MVWFKSCPKCQTGDLLLARDRYGTHVHCVQCGYTKEVDALHLIGVAAQPGPRPMVSSRGS